MAPAATLGGVPVPTSAPNPAQPTQAATPAAGAPEGQQPAAQAPAAGSEAKPIEVKWPEGFTVDAEAAKAFTGLVGELKLDGAGAQKLADLYAGQVKAQAAAGEKAFKDFVAGNVAAAKADPELGGAKWNATLVAANKAAQQLGGQELVEVLNTSGLALHPAVLRLLARAGQAIAEDTIAGTGAEAPPAKQWTEKTLAEALYGQKRS